MVFATRPQTDRQLIDQALSDGRTTYCAPGYALGALSWPPWTERRGSGRGES